MEFTGWLIHFASRLIDIPKIFYNNKLKNVLYNILNITIENFDLYIFY